MVENRIIRLEVLFTLIHIKSERAGVKLYRICTVKPVNIDGLKDAIFCIGRSN